MNNSCNEIEELRDRFVPDRLSDTCLTPVCRNLARDHHTRSRLNEFANIVFMEH